MEEYASDVLEESVPYTLWRADDESARSHWRTNLSHKPRATICSDAAGKFSSAEDCSNPPSRL